MLWGNTINIKLLLNYTFMYHVSLNLELAEITAKLIVKMNNIAIYDTSTWL